MNFIAICSLLVLSASSCTSKDTDVETIRVELLAYVNNGLKNFTGSENHQFTMKKDDCIAQNGNTLVWKGFYSNSDGTITNQMVAIKIISNKKLMFQERMIIKALNATKNPNIEKYRIPRVYYQGPFLQKYNAIAMSLFDRTLFDYYENERQARRAISDKRLLTIFKHVVEGLRYLHSMNVVHNDIKPENIFLRGDDAFISDFDLATLNGAQSRGRTRLFASAAVSGKRNRMAMDDLESLVYSIWYVSDVPMIRDGDSVVNEGAVLNSCTKKEAETRVLKKCDHYQNPHVREVMKFICVNQMLSGKPVPDYDEILAKLDQAILNC